MFCWVPSHVGIQGNERVDVLAKLALTEAYTHIKIPYTDLVYYAKLHLRKNWQFFWDQQVQSKLHAVHPELGLWPHSSQERRRDELILCRLRIGTYIPDTPALTGWRSSTSLCLLSGTFVRGAHPDSLCRIH